LLIGFFKELDKHFDIKVVLGNHDAHLNEAISESCTNELLLGRAALLHGNKWPSEEAIKKEIIVTAHNHIAVTLFDKNNAFYKEKAWLIAPIEKGGATKFYKTPRARKLIVMPAYNDLILGMPVNKMSHKENINPLFRNNIFDYNKAEIYTIRGEPLGTVERLKAKTAL
jgi:metallophosphoesterase superfamily enzyme